MRPPDENDPGSRGAASDDLVKRAFLRHGIATLAYRGARVLRDVPDSFATHHAGDADAGSRTAIQILAHTSDLLDWTAVLLSGGKGWVASPPRTWAHEVDRFFAGLEKVDSILASPSVPSLSLERLFQGPISDAFTHIGQLALLRRLAGAPIRGEVMILSEISAGRVGPDQAPPVREFDRS